VQTTAAGALTTENAKAPAPIAAPRSVLLIDVIAKLPVCVSQAANDSARVGFRRNVRMRSCTSVVDLKFLPLLPRARKGTSDPKTTLEAYPCLVSHYAFDRLRAFEPLMATMAERFGGIAR
jgi:hypothetical protein